MIKSQKHNKVRPREISGSSSGDGECSKMNPIGECSSNLLDAVAFPDLLDDCKFEETPIKYTSRNNIGGGSPKSSVDFQAFAFPDLLDDNSACDEPTNSITTQHVSCNLFPDIDESQTNMPFSETSNEKRVFDEHERIRQEGEARRAEQAERFKREQEARVKKAEEAQRRLQDIETTLITIEEDVDPVDDMSSYDAINLVETNPEPKLEHLLIAEDVSSSVCENINDHNTDNPQKTQSINARAIFREEVGLKNQDTCNPDLDSEMRLVRFDFEPNASFELGLQDSNLKGHEYNLNCGDLEPFIFEPRSIDGSQITNSIMVDDDRLDMSKNTQSAKHLNHESLRKIGSPKWNNSTRNPHTEFLSRKYDSKRIVDILDSFSINQNIPTSMKNDCHDDVWSVGNPIAGFSSLVSAPRLCDATSKIPYSISFSIDEDEDDHNNQCSITSASSHIKSNTKGSEKLPLSDGSKKLAPKVIVKEDVHVRIKKKLAKVRSRKSNALIPSKHNSSDDSLDATASLSLSRATDVNSSIKSASTDPLPIPIAKFDEEKPWRKPTIVFHQLYSSNSVRSPIPSHLSEDELIFHLKSRIQNLLAENVPANIHVDRHNIILDHEEDRHRMMDNLKKQAFIVNDALLNSLRARLRELECDFGSLKSEKTSGTGKSIDEIKAKLRSLEYSHSSGSKSKLHHVQ
jgi:hypothetical protein